MDLCRPLLLKSTASLLPSVEIPDKYLQILEPLLIKQLPSLQLQFISYFTYLSIFFFANQIPKGNPFQRGKELQICPRTYNPITIQVTKITPGNRTSQRGEIFASSMQVNIIIVRISCRIGVIGPTVVLSFWLLCLFFLKGQAALKCHEYCIFK